MNTTLINYAGFLYLSKHRYYLCNLVYNVDNTLICW